jgi:anti-sigma B factor antagonist
MEADSRLGIDVRDVDRHTVLILTGEIDVYSAHDLRAELARLEEAGRHDIVLDLSGVEFFDSTALGVLVAAYKQAARCQGSLGLVGLTDKTMKVVRVTGLERIFAVFASLDEALGADGPAQGAIFDTTLH